ncbi:MAG TPA: TetR/AcrR family transcriptional regulator [Acidimicrobiales bacterium]|nr:TetR/AcrR family transcriptional regulator [Acidimicrobiales bacterium]
MTTAGTPAQRHRPGKPAILRAAVEVMGEDGYEGASIRDIAARAGVSVAALYYHFPSKLDMLREFLDEAHDVTLARLDRRLAAADPSPPAQLDEAVATLIATHLHDEFARLASNVAWREHTRLHGAERAAVDAKRRQLHQRVEAIVAAGVASGDFAVAADPHEVARAILILTSSLVEPYAEMGRTMPDVIALYQGFARNIVACIDGTPG